MVTKTPFVVGGQGFISSRKKARTFLLPACIALILPNLDWGHLCLYEFDLSSRHCLVIQVALADSISASICSWAMTYHRDSEWFYRMSLFLDSRMSLMHMQVILTGSIENWSVVYWSICTCRVPHGTERWSWSYSMSVRVFWLCQWYSVVVVVALWDIGWDSGRMLGSWCRSSIDSPVCWRASKLVLQLQYKPVPSNKWITSTDRRDHGIISTPKWCSKWSSLYWSRRPRADWRVWQASCSAL